MKSLYSFLILLLTSQAYAVRPFISAGIGQFRANDELLGDTIQRVSLGAETRHWGGSIDILHYNQANKVNHLNPGTFTMMPVAFNLYLRGRATRNLGVRIGGGANWVFVNHEMDKSITNSADLYANKLKEFLKDGLGYQVLGGAEYRMSPHLYLGLDVMYLFFMSNYRLEVRGSDRYGIETRYSSSNDLKLDSLIWTFGVKYKF